MNEIKEKKPMGGKRPGAGRKPLGAVPLKRYDVMLSDVDSAIAVKIGDGNRSFGIRRALQWVFGVLPKT